MKRLIAFYMNGQFGKFLLAGGLAAGLNFGSRFIFDLFFNYWISVSLAYLVGFFTAFTLNRLFVFPASGKALHREMAWFFLFNALAFPPVLAVAVGLERAFSHIAPLWIAEAAAHGIAIIMPVFVNFAAHKFITFRSPS
ncbi:GtrA family protein [Xanthobacter sp. DSM 24535]|uniref:GtrA family protein n=1 Tax=Roseixanthobacter psychrophilus TaxID=3119917 RepID=UPI0037283A40